MSEWTPPSFVIEDNDKVDPIPTTDSAEAKRDALVRKLWEIARDVAESPISNPWHIEELAEDVRKLHDKVKMASYQ